MGIQGLLPFVKKACREVHIKEFSGGTAAVDTYCWLHKGAFSCAERLAKGEKTDGYVAYCMKMTNTLVAAGVRPVLVFDGQRLPSKQLTERKRREQRETNRQKAKQFLIEGRIKEARECYQRAVDITPEMALDLIKECRRRGIDYIVAPYEADAQLAYLTQRGLADVVITEDSDLILFGCEKVVFKMDQGGFGTLYERSAIGKCLGNCADRFTHDKFRQMCILSGCDYLQSLPGIGLAKACKFFGLITNPDLKKTLPKLPSYLKMPSLTVDEGYLEGFLKAENTFLHQLVFCPLQNRLVPLNPYRPGMVPEELPYAGQYVSDELAFQMAIGNINVNTGTKVDDYVPFDGKVLSLEKSKDIDKETKNAPNGDSKPKAPRLGAFEITKRRSAPTSAVAKTTPRPSRTLKSMENIGIVLETDDEDDFQHKSLRKSPKRTSEPDKPRTPKSPSPRVQNQPENIFKVAPKPAVLRSRFFSSPPARSSQSKLDGTKLTEWQRKVDSETGPDIDPPLSPVVRRRASPTKFQWGSTTKTKDLQTTPVSRLAATPFKKLRLSDDGFTTPARNNKPLADEEQDAKQTNDDPIDTGDSYKRPRDSDDEMNDTNTSKRIDKNRNTSLLHRSGSKVVPRVHDDEQELDEDPLGAATAVTESGPQRGKAPFNPFAKRLIALPPQKKAEQGSELGSDAESSDGEDPLLRYSMAASRKSDPKIKADDLDESLSAFFEDESPLPRSKQDPSETNDAVDFDRVASSCCSSFDFAATPKSAPNVREEGEMMWSSCELKDVTGDSDSDDLTVVKEFFVQKTRVVLGNGASAKRCTLKRPIKKAAATKPRRLGLSKAKPKRDAAQPSILETLARFKFKQ
ncbi:hypothetical protein HPB47_018013 [Ixodes persulcatus]|uniref:Uncharacterized protein n=1 Tax=Ixodes persulcatus TaxID=34615 RepID=A0AC60QM20_IXOPE|nr:hypothetical protein HPB47_018013 [Ixodes persulcatus]